MTEKTTSNLGTHNVVSLKFFYTHIFMCEKLIADFNLQNNYAKYA